MAQSDSARNTFRSLLSDHDLLLVDNRGTGASAAVKCPLAQHGFSPEAIEQCKQILGSRADDYGTLAAVDDLAAVLSRVRSNHVDVYAESYGTFFAQVFALRYPQLLHRLVLDGALPLDVDPWRRDALLAGLAALRKTCTADPICRAGGDPVKLLAEALPIIRLGTKTLDTKLDSAVDLAMLVANAGRRGSAYRELPAALRSMLASDPVPLIRLLDEAAVGGFGAAARSASLEVNSSGLFLADTCADFPQPFDLRTPVAQQRHQFDEAFRRVTSTNKRTFAPFTSQEAFARRASLCLGWPAPTHPLPDTLAGSFPSVPTLVLEGALDTITAPAAARAVAREFPNSRYLEVPFVGHLAAVNDETHCASDIVSAFLAARTLDTRCLSHIPAPAQVEQFPLQFAQETPVTSINPHALTGLSLDERRTVAVARDAISDVLWRWGPLGFYSSKGLRGGTYTTIPPLEPGHYSVHLNQYRWTTDTTVTGDLTTSPTTYTMTGHLLVTTPIGRASLMVRSARILPPSATETISGIVSGHRVDLRVDARVGP